MVPAAGRADWGVKMRVDARWFRYLVPAVLSAAVALPAFAADQQQQGVNVQQLQQRVQRLENIIDSGQLAQLIQKVNSLEQDIRNLRGQIQTQAHRIDELRKRQRNLYADLDRRLRNLEVAQKNTGAQSGGGQQGQQSGAQGASTGGSAGAGGGSASASGGATQQASAGSGSASGDNSAAAERKGYDAAFNLLKDGRYDDAAKAFEDFLQKHSGGPYADNAQYWLGESYYVTRHFDKALQAFRNVGEKFPDSAKVPDARLKIGYTLYELGRVDDAKTELEQVRKQYPDSSVARLAEDRLVRIKRDQEQQQDSNANGSSDSNGN